MAEEASRNERAADHCWRAAGAGARGLVLILLSMAAR